MRWGTRCGNSTLDRIGHVVTKGTTLEEANAAMERALANIVLEIAETE